MDNRELWASLGMDLDKHDDFLAPLEPELTAAYGAALSAKLVTTGGN